VITGGGLGPTEDDLTRQVIAEATANKLIPDPALIKEMELRFRNRGLIMTRNNERQAYIPEHAVPVRNPNGTAPAFIVEYLDRVIIALPGVPFELKWLFNNEMVPYLKKRFSLSHTITHRILKIADIGESAVDDLIGHIISNSSNPTVGVLAHPGQVDVRITAKATDEHQAMDLIAPVEEYLRNLLDPHVFAFDQESMEDIVGGLLEAKGIRIATYEDITGGMVAERLTQASPNMFIGGIISSNVGFMTKLIGKIDSDNSHKEFTNTIASTIRRSVDAHLGLAVHGTPDIHDKSENLARGHTTISITDGKSFMTQSYNTAGRGKPDRTRISMNAIGLVRTALTSGFT
jgi:nicotinamide-nucleotide amidase